MNTYATHEKLRMLPPGSVTARGWIRQQLERSKDGMGGHLDELEPDMIASPYIDRHTHGGIGHDIHAGWGAEQSGNYWYGLIQLAFALDDEALKAKAEGWVNGALANQDENGYLGPYTENDNRMDDFNGFGTGSGLSALQAYYDATGREDVLTALLRCMLWFCDHWAGDKKTRYCGQALVFNMAWCHRHTGEPKLLTFIDEYFDFLNRNDICGNSINAMRSSKLDYTAIHAAALALLPKYASAGYMAAGREEYLDAAVNLVKKIEKKLLLPTGGLASNTEYTSPVAENTETEYCTYGFFQNALIWLGSITGDPHYYDISERIALNGAQGARKKDEKAIAYFTSPNQLFASSQSDFMGGDMGAYAPCYPTACCPVTSVWIMPDYLQGMALTDRDGNAYIAAYGPARINFGDLALESDTLYPFRDSINYTVQAASAVGKTFHFRIPAWCKGAEITINGRAVEGDKIPGSYFAVTSKWQQGDIIALRLPMAASINRLDDSDSWRHYPLVVEYGPLVFSLPVPEQWRVIPGSPRTPLPEGWYWYEVEPKAVYHPDGDVYEQPCLRKYIIDWNVALDENLDLSDIRVAAHEGGYVWEHPPLTLTLPAYKALYSYAPYIRKTHVVYQAPVDVQEKQQITLVPYGCTNLRITCLPRANVPVGSEPMPSQAIGKNQ